MCFHKRSFLTYRVNHLQHRMTWDKVIRLATLKGFRFKYLFQNLNQKKSTCIKKYIIYTCLALMLIISIESFCRWCKCLTIISTIVDNINLSKYWQVAGISSLSLSSREKSAQRPYNPIKGECQGEGNIQFELMLHCSQAGWKRQET